MSSQVVTLALDGEPTIEDYLSALEGFQQMLDLLGATVASDQPIRWTIDALDKSSAITTLRGESQDLAAVERVAAEYLRVGYALASADPAERLALPSEIRRSADRVLGILNGRVPAVRFETADDDVTIQSGTATTLLTVSIPPSDFPGAYGAVEGRIQTLSSRNSLRFTLYDVIHDKAVSCYLQEGQQEMVRGLWDRLAVVEGFVKRDAATSRPTAVRRIRRIEPVAVAEEGAWRRVRGLVDSPVPAEDLIRRARDAQ